MVMATLALKKPKKSCEDKNCPFHGNLRIRGRVLDGVVISAKMDKTVVVRRDYQLYVPKFKRYERRHSHINAHNPPCLDVQEDEKVRIAECRPVSKTVSFVVVEKVEEERGGSEG
jgi:small subunit ribosomal protein S17